ncbi:uncharacterized protein STEHIDRAFT_158792 [Stereum hirsutum FP-91666 SS1]|uniref:uncharacterized protein n=1 Tax=Stereum hirsutum (strain FP-91666) TaxID=721885 RepID=UPI000444A251|nr:uncharacterized protein STEHIDRAFT_158792 [Stereum hirsutum FP-91666 SS1]EIM85098.1 hypothetical protein STEHIDRAFT_158792 [Stereum hirsutum FP-91666 SS1]
MANNTCLVCRKRAKRKDSQFCSDRCTQKMASKKLPQLLRVPKDHAMYNDVKKKFRTSWKDKKNKLPVIGKIYLITWPRKMRASFEKYRDSVAKLRKTPKNKAKECKLCQAIRTGFKASLDKKRGMVKRKSKSGIRFGGGVYMSPESNKALEYAKDSHRGSQYLAVLVTRTVLGKMQHAQKENHGLMKPKNGYDSVFGRANGGGPLEYIVYNANAVRPAYLMLLKRK